MRSVYENTSLKLLTLILICIIIGLITKPIFPWLYVEKIDNGTKKYYYGECEIHLSGEENKYFNLMENDLKNIGICFWFALIFGVIGICGNALFKSEIYKIKGSVLLILGGFTLLFSILIMIFHWTYIKHIEDYKINLVGFESSSISAAFYYNFIPLTMAILIFGFSLAYIAVIVPNCIRIIQSELIYRYHQNVYNRFPSNFYKDKQIYPQFNVIKQYPMPSIPPPNITDYKIRISKIDERLKIWREKLVNREISNETYKDIESALIKRKIEFENKLR